MAAQNQGDLFDAYFRRADLDKDGRISGAEAVAFFQGSNLSKPVLAQIWTYANQNRADHLGRVEFYNALKLVTVAQSKRELTPDIVKAALYSPASAKIPAPQINLAALPAPQLSTTGATLSTPQIPTVGSVAAQNSGFGPALQNTTMNQPYNQSPDGGIVRPPTSSSGVAVSQQPVQGVGSQGFPGGAPLSSSSMPNFRPSNDVGAANAGKAPKSVFSDRGNSPLANLAGLQSGTPGPVASLPPKPPVTPGVTSLPSAMQPRPQVSQNGFASGSHTGGASFAAAPSELKKNVPGATSSAGTVQIPSASAPVPAGTKSIAAEQSKMQAMLKAQTSSQNFRPSGPSAVLPPQSAGRQPQPQWPRATQTDIQKYTKVFIEVDTDKDGKISGQQARDLFLSWRLPREVLMQVWDLSDQDNDSMLSVREFCIALYLMERFREGRRLPSELPSSVMLDFSATAQPASGYGNSAWGYSGGVQQPVPGTGPRPSARPPGKPPLPIPAPLPEDRLPPKPPKAKVPVLEKHLVDQLSEEEQKSLNLKFQEATEANKKVEELEKEIKESREKIEFYRVKMQELVLYKSRCDSRLNEVTERAAGDKREVESLAKKYEEKYRQTGDVASRLSIEEATFRDIQERKMEMYQAIVKMEQDGTDETLQVRANQIQSNLEDLVRSLSERCKKYGLRAKPTTLVELPFGWQPGIQEGAADWDEEWDKFEDEGFTLVKEMTLDVQNVIAPPKPKVKISKKDNKLAAVGDTSIQSSEAESKHVKATAEDGTVAENGVIAHEKDDNTPRSPVTSPSGQGSLGSPHDRSEENHSETTIGSNKESRSDNVDTKSDEPIRGTFDTSDDADSVWGSSKRPIDDLFGHGEFTLPPIRTGSSRDASILPKKSIFADSVPGTPADIFLPPKSIFVDSVPGTPADGFIPKPSIFADSVPGTPADGYFSKQSIFADSVPSTPLFKDGEGQEDRGFNFSRFDSFRSTDSGFQPQERLSRFDSTRSNNDFDSQDGGSFQQRETFSRFDSMRSTNESDFGTRFSSFDDSDPFGSGAFQTSFENETPRRDSDAFASSAFRSSLGSETPRSEVDPFGSVGPFRSTYSSETPRADSDPFGSVGPFRSSLGSETPRGEGDHYGSGGAFRSSYGSETPRADADQFGSVGPFGSSMVSETPRGGADYFRYSGSFNSSIGNETPRGGFDSFGFGGPFGAETPRHDSDSYGAGPFTSSFSSETPKGGTDSWSAF